MNVPEHQCCGMPLVDIGDYYDAVKKMDSNLECFSKLVDEGYDIVVPQPTCTLVFREDYPMRSKEAEAAKKVAENTYEIGQYLTISLVEKYCCATSNTRWVRLDSISLVTPGCRQRGSTLHAC